MGSETGTTPVGPRDGKGYRTKPPIPKNDPIVTLPKKKPAPAPIEPPVAASPVPLTPGGSVTWQSNVGNVEGKYLVGPNRHVPILYGRLLISPDVVFAEQRRYSGSQFGKFWSVISEGPIEGVEAYFSVGAHATDWYEDEATEIPESLLIASETNDWTGFFQDLALRTGTLDQTAVDDKLGPLPGVAHVVATTGWARPGYPRGIFKGRKLYDPRLGPWGAGEYPDPACCAYESAGVVRGSNPALIMADMRTFPQYGLGDAPTAIDWASVAAAANWCDEIVDGEKRCEVHLYIRDTRKLKDWMDTVGLHAGLYWRQEGGLWALRYSAPVSTVSATITTKDLVAGTRPRVLYGGGAGFADLPNRVTVEWTHVPAYGPDLPRYPFAVGWYVRSVTLTHPEVDAGAAVREGQPYKLHGLQSEKAAYRAAWRILREIWSGLEIELDLMPAMAGLVAGNRVTLNIPEIGLASKDFLIDTVTDNGTAVHVTGHVYDETTWTPGSSGSNPLPTDGYWATPPDLSGVALYNEITHTADFFPGGYHVASCWNVTVSEKLGFSYGVPTSFPYLKQVRVRIAGPPETRHKIATIEANLPGTGYAVGDKVVPKGIGGAGFAASVTSVDVSGGITGIAVTGAHEWFWGSVSFSVESVAGSGARLDNHTDSATLPTTWADLTWDSAPMAASEVVYPLTGNRQPPEGSEGAAILTGRIAAAAYRGLPSGWATSAPYRLIVRTESLAGKLSAGVTLGGPTYPPVADVVAYLNALPDPVQTANGYAHLNAVAVASGFETLSGSAALLTTETAPAAGKVATADGGGGITFVSSVASATDADTVDGQHAADFAAASHGHAGTLDANARTAVKKSGVLVGTRRGVNLIPGTNVTIDVSDDAANEDVDVTITASGGSGVPDGDKGDISVSSGGTVWTIDPGAVTTTKLGGDITPQGKALLDDPDSAAQRATLNLGTAAVLDAPPSGNAAAGQVVKGSDTRLTDARTPTTHSHDLATGTTGTLAVGRGGTGATDAATARTNLGAAAAGHTHPGSDVTSAVAEATNADTLDGVHRIGLFNNQGAAHGSYTFATIPDFGIYHVTDTGGPEPGAGQYFVLCVGIGSYAFASYAHQIAYPRTGTGGTMTAWARQREAGTWGAWTKVNAADAATLGGAAASEIDSASTIAKRTVNGYLFAVYFNQSSANNENPTISQVMVTNGGDGYLRKASLAHLKTSLGTMPPSSHSHAGGDITSAVANATNATRVSASSQRILFPGGAVYEGGTSVTGAWKIKLPPAVNNSHSMVTIKVRIYDYSTGGLWDFTFGGYNYLTQWVNVSATQTSDTGPAKNIIFGHDADSDCIWIGSVSDVWSYPKVYVTEVTCGFAGVGAAWETGWSISPVTSYDTVEDNRVAAMAWNQRNHGSGSGLDADTLDGLHASSLATPGEVRMWAGSLATLQPGWLVCDGSAVSRTTYAVLFATIGTYWGAGDGSSTFNLPDLRGRFALGVAASGTGSGLGQTGGAIDHVHAKGTLAADSVSGANVAQSGSDLARVSTHGHTISGSTAAANPPFAALYFIIKT